MSEFDSLVGSPSEHAEADKVIAEETVHFRCLAAMSKILNESQDIEDVFMSHDEGSISDITALRHIRELNNIIMTTVADYLPG